MAQTKRSSPLPPIPTHHFLGTLGRGFGQDVEEWADRRGGLPFTQCEVFSDNSGWTGTTTDYLGSGGGGLE